MKASAARPDPESLFADRGRLAWNEERQTISIHLPPVAGKLLPATWRLGDREQPAVSTASEFLINGSAFAKNAQASIQGKRGQQTANHCRN